MTEQEIQQSMAQDTDYGSRAMFDTYYNYVYAIVYRILQDVGSREDVEEWICGVSDESRDDLITSRTTWKQNIERQERNILAAYPNAQIFKERYTGTKTQG